MLRWLLLAVLVLVATPMHAAEPVALVTELNGAGTLGVKPRARALELLQDLAPGSLVSLARGARAVIVHTATGVVYELAGPGAFQVRAKSIVPADSRSQLARRELPAELRAYKLDPAVATQASIVLRGGSEPRLEGPDGGVLAEDELAYRIVGAVRAVRFEVFDEQGARAIQIDALEGGAVDLRGRHPWIPGHRYRVQASGENRLGQPVSVTARFVLLAPEAGTRLRDARPGDATARTDWMVYALALESAGADASARAVWRALAQAR